MGAISNQKVAVKAQNNNKNYCINILKNTYASEFVYMVMNMHQNLYTW